MGQEYSNDENGEIPTDQGGTEQDPSTTNLQDLSGYRVMKVFPGSPASRSGLHPFEDFIMALNGVMVISDKAALGNVLRANEGNEVGLSVWNCVDQVKRDVALRPVKWHGPGLLGAAVRYEPLQGAMEFVQRVIDVLPQSPADDAGLTPYTDYIVGTPAEVFRNNGDFQRLILEALENNSAASFMVYSTATSRTRNIEIKPNRNWGGEGAVGCEMATGLLHQITRTT